MPTAGRMDRGEAAHCPSRRHGDEATPSGVVPGLRICAACRDMIEDELIELPALFELSTHMLDPRPPLLRERVNGHRPRGIVLRDAVVSVRSEILETLAAWCGLVVTERQVTGPDVLDIRKLAKFLGVHLQWLCQHPAAPDLVDELAELAAAVTEALQPNTGFRIAIGPCPRPGCDRIVHAEAHREGDEPYEVSCEAGHVWAPEHWLSLRGRTGEEAHGADPSAEGAE